METMSDMDFDIEGAISQLTSKICDDEAQAEYLEAMEIEGTNVNQCCIDQPTLMMKAVLYYEQANAEADALKDVITRAYAHLDPQARQLIAGAGEKLTEARVDSVIKTHDEYVALQERYHAARTNAGKWKAIMEGARHRKDMLVQIASNYRAEGNSEISIRQNMDAVKNIVGK